MPTLARIVRRILTAAVALACVASTAGLAAVALLPAFGARAMVVTSGSMHPAIPTGGLAVVVPVDAGTLASGDVITFRGFTGAGMTTHRIISRHEVGGRLHFRTQGDANDTPDVDLAPATAVLGRVALDVPYAGRALGELQRPEVRLVALGVPALWMVVANAFALTDALRRRAQRGAAVSPQLPIVTLLLVAALVAAGSSGSAAILTDAVTITDNTFSTGTWTLP